VTYLICPNCGHDTFSINAIEYHTWTVKAKVNGQPDFVADEGCDDSYTNPDPSYVCHKCHLDFCERQLVLPKLKYRVGLRAFTGVVELNVEASSKEEAVDLAHELLMEEIQKDGCWNYEVDFTLSEAAI
jgi:hypothetical protein